VTSGGVDHQPDLRLGGFLALVVVGFPSVLVWWTLSVRDRLPDPVARHWGARGTADGFSSVDETLWLTVGLTLLVAAPMAVVAVVSRQPVTMRRFLAGIAAWLTVFLTILMADSLRGQLDLVDPAQAPMPGPGILIGVVVGVAVGVAVASAARRQSETALASDPPPPSAVRRADPGRDLSWRACPVGLDRVAVVVCVVAVLGLGTLTVVVSWWLASLTVLLVLLLSGMGRVTTWIDADGLVVRMFGIRLLRVPLVEVAEADVVEVDPFWEFGGWGLRMDTAGRVGVVTRKGEALRVRRGDGTEVLVTVDGATEAASTLNTLADGLHRT
jgi:hypothetical protein